MSCRGACAKRMLYTSDVAPVVLNRNTDYKPRFQTTRFSKTSPKSENSQRLCHAVFQKLSRPRLCDIDGQPPLRECANRPWPLSSAFPDSTRRFLRAFQASEMNRAG